MPREHFGSEHEFLDKEEILSYEEITKITSAMIPLGLSKIRITGGEPLIRKDIAHLIGMLRTLDGEIDLALTTNGVLLKQHAKALVEAGLNRVTVSLDALEVGMFQAMGDTRHTPFEVLEGIDEAIKVGLKVKVNTVVQRNLNENEVASIAQECFDRGITPRFIEFMDVGTTNKWNLESVVPGDEIREILAHEFGPLSSIPTGHPSDVAKLWQTGQGHSIGMIQSVTAPFCGDCSRARISANGSLYTCLFATQGSDLRALLRFGAAEEDIDQAIQSIWTNRRDRYSETRSNEEQPQPKIEMSFIGG